MSNGLTVNQKVLVYARGQTGKQVGTGECYGLADKVLGQVGALMYKDPAAC